MYTKQDLKDHLIAMDLKPTDAVMMHSSMKAIGDVEGGADTVLDALMEYLGMEEYVLPAFETDAGELKKALSDLLSRREEVTAALRQRTGELSRLAEADLEEALKLMQ